MKSILIIFIFLVFYTIGSSQTNTELLFINGSVYTFDNNDNVFEAIAVDKGKILDVGSNAQLLKNYKASAVIDLKGKTVVPGFIEGHGHLISYGRSLLDLNLLGTKSKKEIADKLKNYIKNFKKGEWIKGNSWDQNDWKNKEWPTSADIDEVSKYNPVVLTRIDGHAVWVNSLVLRLANITKDTKDPEGGKILRDKNGNPTGILIDNAIGLIYEVMPLINDEYIEKAILKAQEKLLEYGITEFHDMGIDKSGYDILTKLYQNGKLKIRYRGYTDGQNDLWNILINSEKQKSVFQNDDIKIIGIKLFADGAMGSRGAAFFEPYSDDKDNYGLITTSEKEIYEITKQALLNGYQVATHAIGDKAINITINAYEQALKETEVNDHRLRIEHVQVINPTDAERMAKLKIIPSMQPVHATSDMYWAEARLGRERVRWSYAWNLVLKNSPFIIGGSDVPVENPSVIDGLYAAITRKDKAGHPNSLDDLKKLISEKKFVISDEGFNNAEDFNNGWYPQQKVSLRTAVSMFTKYPPYASKEESVYGTIEKNKLANLTILSKDIFKLKPEDLLKTKIDMTVIDGKIVYKR